MSVRTAAKHQANEESESRYIEHILFVQSGCWLRQPNNEPVQVKALWTVEGRHSTPERAENYSAVPRNGSHVIRNEGQ